MFNCPSCAICGKPVSIYIYGNQMLNWHINDKQVCPVCYYKYKDSK